MQLLEHYARLYERWKQRPFHSDSFMETTVPGLAAWFHCSERNVKLLIKAMQGQGWISWQPGRGRGHHSLVCCHAVPDLLMVEYAGKLLNSGDVQEAAKLLQSPFLTEQGKEMLLHEIKQSFSFRHHGKEPNGGTRNSLRFLSYRQPGSLDPAYATRRTELHWIRQLFDTLVLYDPEQQMYQPGLAHYWESDSTARRWRFYLQKQVQFHNRASFTAEDVRFTLERLIPSESGAGASSPYSRLFAGLEKVVPIHDHLVEIRWKDSCRQLLSLFTLTPASIVPSSLTGNWPMEPVGTGPFLLARREERVIVLKANPSYYRRPTNLDQVEMWYLPEIYEQGTAKELEEQEAGGMNFWHYWGGQQAGTPWERLESMDRGCKYVLMNQAKPGILQQKGMREHIYEVIRQGNAADQLGGNRGGLAYSFVRGLERSKDMYNNCLSVTCEPFIEPVPAESVHALQLVTYAGAGHERDAAWLQQELGKWGVSLSVRIVPYDKLSQAEVLSTADLMLLEQPVDADEEGAMWTIVASDQSPLRSCLPIVQLQKLEAQLLQLSHEPSRSERLRGLTRLEQELLDDRSVVLWFRWRQMAYFPAELQGVKISPLGWVDYKDLWFKE